MYEILHCSSHHPVVETQPAAGDCHGVCPYTPRLKWNMEQGRMQTGRKNWAIRTENWGLTLHLLPLRKGTHFSAWQNRFRDVAQPGSALAWGARGRKFESCRPDKKKTGLTKREACFLLEERQYECSTILIVATQEREPDTYDCSTFSGTLSHILFRIAIAGYLVRRFGRFDLIF